VELLQKIIVRAEEIISLDEMYAAVRAVPDTGKYRMLVAENHL